ncbi:sugar-binding transcriptional regulator [Candidatus Halocynthiibacter alkanivorans]|uniref:sugar-binding transcriptional regulator n=1 Tax=Candidatus Halocynthiibacter alkanivorans TaxID=2267619 RepID=UPI00190F1CFA|nr:sugar-binding transcriptional regulator [Candidatus Halocynthiibacter alkanivorans]
MITSRAEFESMRLMARVLTLYYEEGRLQSRIAAELGLSSAKVNRLIKQGRELGMVEIIIRTPFQPLFDLETRIKELAEINDVLVTPTVSDNPDVVLQNVGGAAADLLLKNLKDGDTICITGGKGVSAVVEGLNPERTYDIEVVPATGCVQGKHYTDVNHVATQLAEKLGGRAYQIHAPLFAETVEQKDMLMAMRSVNEVLDRARQATLAIVGVGSILSEDSTYYDLHPTPKGDRDEINRAGAVGELLAHLMDKDGNVCDYDLNSRLVGLSPAELANVPLTMGVASGASKIAPIASALRGHHLKALVVDEATANGVLETLSGEY